MSGRTRVLHVEDNAVDSELVSLWLREAGLDWEVQRVESRDALVSALEQGSFDVIVSDFSMPSFNGLEALRETRQRRPELAFVFFTAALGEERAVDALKAGATDFVAKERPGRLIPALQRAVKESEERGRRRRAEASLRQREASFRLLFEGNPHPMWVFDQETLYFLEVNPVAVERYGYSRDEFLGMRITDIRPPEDRARLVASVHTGRGPEDVRVSGNWRHRLKDGRLIDVEVAAHDILFEGRPGRLVVAHDVTEHKQLEARLLQSQKLEAVGQLAAGLAHDFNNLLNVMLGYSDLLAKELPPEGPQQRRLDHIRHAAERGAALTRQLLAFSRRQVLEPKVLDLNDALTELQSMLVRLIGEDVKVVTAFAGELWPVLADPGQIEQVVMNLAVNARDAMPQGGTLILETANVELDDAFPRTHPGFTPGQYVRLAVSDTGQGIDAATLTRIFEPFFTTKPRGRGTGLGLATVHGIVKQSGGHIEVYSELGRGTSFKIYLPRCSDETCRPDGPGRSVETPRGSETILLVEDDEALRDLIREMLAESGYHVLEAADPERGLEIAKGFDGEIHLLMTDVILPGIGGNELAARVREIRPGLSVLFMSGYTDQALGHHGVIGAGTQFLQKPFALPVLLQKLRSILED